MTSTSFAGPCPCSVRCGECDASEKTAHEKIGLLLALGKQRAGATYTVCIGGVSGAWFKYGGHVYDILSVSRSKDVTLRRLMYD